MMKGFFKRMDIEKQQERRSQDFWSAYNSRRCQKCGGETEYIPNIVSIACTTDDTSKERGILNADLSHSIVLCPECTRNIGKIIEIPIPQDEFDGKAKKLL